MVKEMMERVLGAWGETLGEAWKPWILVLGDGEKGGNEEVEKKIRDGEKWGKGGLRKMEVVLLDA